MNPVLLNSLTLDDFTPDSSATASILRALTQALEQIRFGTVEIVIQDGKVVQINRTEKIRF